MAMPEHVNPFDAALRQLQDFGLEIETLDTSGKIVAVHHVDDRQGTKKGWYVAHLHRLDDGREIVVGTYGWWKDPFNWHKLKYKVDRLSESDRAEIQRKAAAAARQAEQARADKAKEAERRAGEIWGKLPDSGTSAYLERKGVRAFGVRFSRGSIVLPVRAADNRLVGLQFIDPDGAKRFLTGTAKSGAFHLIGTPGEAPSVIGIAEGYATAATVHMARGCRVPVVVAFDSGNLKAAALAARARWPEALLIFFADDDRATAGNPGRAKAEAAAKAVGGLVWLPPLGEHPGTDWNDLQAAIGLDGVKTALDELWAQRPQDPPKPVSNVVAGAFQGVEWQQRLQRTDKGVLKATAFNLRLILENDPAWKGVIGWCEFSARIMKKRPPPYANASRGEWTDADDADLRFWLGEHYGIEPKGQDLADPVQGAARKNPFHPVREYLDGLRWDGVARVDYWLETYLGCATDPGPEPGAGRPQPERDEWATARQRGARYLRRVSAMALIQAIARVRVPGCKADHVLIIEGEQGKMKSTSLRVLFGEEFFSDTPIDIGSKDAYESIRGIWGVELAELDSLNKADATRAKAFFSSASDRFRMPYGRRAQRFARQCVVCGTTNQHQYLKDQTGNRRYWPVTCGEIDIEALADVRDQLWAEADHRFREGEAWWPQVEDRDLFASEQESRTELDAWEPLIQDYLEKQLNPEIPPLGWRPDQVFVVLADVLKGAVNMDPAAIRRPEQTRAGYVMQRLGWVHARRRRGGSAPVWGYTPGSAWLKPSSTEVDDGPSFE